MWRAIIWACFSDVFFLLVVAMALHHMLLLLLPSSYVNQKQVTRHCHDFLNPGCCLECLFHTSQQFSLIATTETE